jgi:hypothetical protein
MGQKMKWNTWLIMVISQLSDQNTLQFSLKMNKNYSNHKMWSSRWSSPSVDNKLVSELSEGFTRSLGHIHLTEAHCVLVMYKLQFTRTDTSQARNSLSRSSLSDLS